MALPSDHDQARPKVSVVIPCYNRARLLPAAIESARAQGQAVEVIVVDDGSTDESAAVAARYEDVRVIRIDNAGPSAARNRGLHDCQGEYVRFLDSDDRLPPDSTVELLRHAEHLPTRIITFGDARSIDMTGHRVRGPGYGYPDLDAGLIERRRLIQRVMSPCLPLYPAAALREAGGFNPLLRISEDYELTCRMVAMGFSFLHVRAATYEVREHDGERLSREYGKAGYQAQLMAFDHSWRALQTATPALNGLERAAFAAQLWSLGRAASREGCRTEAGRLFDFATSIAGRSATNASLPLRLSYRIMSPFRAERLWTRLKRVFGKTI